MGLVHGPQLSIFFRYIFEKQSSGRIMVNFKMVDGPTIAERFFCNYVKRTENGAHYIFILGYFFHIQISTRRYIKL